MASSQPTYHSNLRITALREAQTFHDQNGFSHKYESKQTSPTIQAEETVATAEIFRSFLAKDFETDE